MVDDVVWHQNWASAITLGRAPPEATSYEQQTLYQMPLMLCFEEGLHKIYLALDHCLQQAFQNFTASILKEPCFPIANFW